MHMKRKTKYTDEPIKFKIIEDFLPSPTELAANELPEILLTKPIIAVMKIENHPS